MTNETQAPIATPTADEKKASTRGVAANAEIGQRVLWERDGMSEYGVVTKINKTSIWIEDGMQERHKLADGEFRFLGALAATLKRYRDTYEDCVTKEGRLSKHNGDPVAVALQGLDHEDVADLAERLLGLGEGFLMRKYSHLNNGQIRMNSGNRIRAAFKKGEITVDDLKTQ